MPVLKLSFGDMVIKEISIAGEPATIGRSPQDSIFIDNPAVSFHHARVFSQAGAYYVQDLGSLNGTFLNGVRITQSPADPRRRHHRGQAQRALLTRPPGSCEARGPRCTTARTGRGGDKAHGHHGAGYKEAAGSAGGLRQGQGGRNNGAGRARGQADGAEGQDHGEGIPSYFPHRDDRQIQRMRHPPEGLVRTENCRHDHQAGRNLPIGANGQHEGFRQWGACTAKVDLKEGDLVAVGKVQMEFHIVVW